jgi:hypothetical protein
VYGVTTENVLKRDRSIQGNKEMVSIPVCFQSAPYKSVGEGANNGLYHPDWGSHVHPTNQEFLEVLGLLMRKHA